MSVVPQTALVECLRGLLDLDAVNALKCALIQSSYTPNPGHAFMSSLTASECTATGYAGGFSGAGRKFLAGVTIAADAALNRAVVDATDPTPWVALGGAVNNTLGYLAVYAPGTTDANSRVVAVLTFASTLATNSGDVAVQFAAAGLFYTQH